MLELVRFHPTLYQECVPNAAFDIHTDVNDQHYHLHCEALSLHNEGSIIQSYLDAGDLDWLTGPIDDAMCASLNPSCQPFVLAIDVTEVNPHTYEFAFELRGKLNQSDVLKLLEVANVAS